MGDAVSTVLTGNILKVNFTLQTTQQLNPIVDIGDIAYFKNAAGNLLEMGAITGISNSDVFGSGFIEVTNTTNTPVATNFVFAVKNSVAESYGLRGHYNEVTLTNSDPTKTNLFAVSSEIFKSYP